MTKRGGLGVGGMPSERMPHQRKNGQPDGREGTSGYQENRDEERPVPPQAGARIVH